MNATVELLPHTCHGQVLGGMGTVTGNVVLLVANPVAHNGAGRETSARVEALLYEAVGNDGGALSPALQDAHIAHRLTEYPGHARELARGSADCRAIIALGGDGLVNELVNGLMELPAEARPALGVLPLGSGNDYARELGMSFDIREALAQLTRAGLLVGAICALIPLADSSAWV